MAAHLETCAVCRAQLDRWTDDPAVLAGATGFDKSTVDTNAVLNEVLERLKRQPGPRDDDESRTEPPEESPSVTQERPPGRSETTTTREADSVKLNFLAPSNRSGGIGRLGPYEVLERIGQGGMGVVLKALDERLNRIVAVKVLAPALAGNTLARRRFLREARAAAAVCHEHVVTIHAVDEVAGHPYLVMQLIAGESLQAKLNRGGPLPVEEILRIGMQVALGLGAAHAQGLVHRDIKPANLLLENGVERVRITDFGLARAIDDASLSASGTIAGTPHYMSPEQARGEPVDHRTDLFSLGSVLYAICTGQPPFRADSTVAVLRKVSDEPPRPIREQNPEIPDWLTAIIGKLMAKDPRERNQSAGEVAEILAGHLAALQHPSRPTPTPTVARPSPKAHRLAEVLAVLLSVAALTLGLLSWWVVRSGDSAPVTRAPVAQPPGEPSRPTELAPPASRPAAENVLRDPEWERALLDQAGNAAQRGDLKRSIELYTAAIGRRPTNVDAWLSRARIYARDDIKNWTGAIADATEAIRLDPKNSAAFELRALAKSRSGDAHGAIADASEAIRLEPKRGDAYLIRGVVYHDLGQWGHAIVDLDEVIRSGPNRYWPRLFRAQAYAGLGENDRALADINRAIELAPGERAFWYERARIHFQKNDPERAFADLKEIVRISPEPEKSRAYAYWAELERSISKIEPAIEHYTEAIRFLGTKVEPAHAGLFAARAVLYLAHAETDRALADLDEAIRLDPKPPWAHHDRGLAHVRKGQWDRAIADFEKEKELAGADRHIAFNCVAGRALVLAVTGRIQEAEAGYEECAKIDPTRLPHHRQVTHAWLIDRPRADYDAALKKLDEAANSVSIWQLLERGLILARLNSPDRALADFTEVLERVKPRPDWFATPDYYPRWLALMLGRGEAHLLKGDFDRALADADEAVRFAPQSAEARLLRARVHDKRGKPDLAEADRRAAARLEPDPMLTLPEPRTSDKPKRT